MPVWLLLAGGLILALVFFYLAFRLLKKKDIPALRVFLGTLIMAYGAYLATLTGTTTHFVMPGLGSVALGAATGGAVGFGTWVVVGTVGVATGGVGIAVGAATMAAVGAVLGGTGGAAGAFGFRAVSYPLVAWYFWVPIVCIGAMFIYGRKKKKLLSKALPTPQKNEGPA